MTATQHKIAQALATISAAKSVFVWCPITRDEGTYFQVTKTQAAWNVRDFADRLGEGELRVCKRGVDVYIGR